MKKNFVNIPRSSMTASIDVIVMVDKIINENIVIINVEIIVVGR